MIDLTNPIAKDGALHALEIILQSRNRNIKVKKSDENSKDSTSPLKMPKNMKVTDVDEEEAEQNKAEGKSSESKEDRASRIKKIKNELEDEEAIQADLDAIKQDIAIKKANAIRAKRAEADRFVRDSAGPADFSGFKTSFYRAIKSQTGLSRNPEDTYSKINPTYANSDLLMPGSAYIEKKEIPIINVYFDRSGSLSSDDEERGKDAISIIDQLQKRKKVKYNMYWFADNISDTPGGTKGATGAFPRILEHVKETRATNVVIFTDSDFDYQSGDTSKLPVVKVKGCVWWIWANGEIAKHCAPHLQSTNKHNTFQFTI